VSNMEKGEGKKRQPLNSDQITNQVYSLKLVYDFIHLFHK
jgi:hypothetical protein